MPKRGKMECDSFDRLLPDIIQLRRLMSKLMVPTVRYVVKHRLLFLP